MYFKSTAGKPHKALRYELGFAAEPDTLPESQPVETMDAIITVSNLKQVSNSIKVPQVSTKKMIVKTMKGI